MVSGSGRRQPKYTAIAADLDAKIKAGVYQPGQALPAQRELSAEYGVTLMTLRQALRLLWERGLVTQHAGRGTFVSSAKAAYHPSSLQSLSDDLRAQGHRVETSVLACGRRRPPRWVADHLGADTGPVLRIERLRWLGGVPAVHQVSWVPEPFATVLRKVDFTADSLYGSLAGHGHAMGHADERVTPAVLSTRVGKLLQRPAGAPVFLSERVTFGRDDTAMVFDRATILGDLMEIRTVRAATTLSTYWTRSSETAERDRE